MIAHRDFRAVAWLAFAAALGAAASSQAGVAAAGGVLTAILGIAALVATLLAARRPARNWVTSEFAAALAVVAALLWSLAQASATYLLVCLWAALFICLTRILRDGDSRLWPRLLLGALSAGVLAVSFWLVPLTQAWLSSFVGLGMVSIAGMIDAAARRIMNPA